MIKQCDVCGEDYKAKHASAKYCPTCRTIVHREQKRLYWHRSKGKQKEEIVMQPMTNEGAWIALMMAVLRSAIEEKDYPFLIESGQTYMDAIGYGHADVHELMEVM